MSVFIYLFYKLCKTFIFAHQAIFYSQGSRFWGMGAIRASKRRSAKRLSLARSLDDLEVSTKFCIFFFFLWVMFEVIPM